jgi:hypothetical protein
MTTITAPRGRHALAAAACVVILLAIAAALSHLLGLPPP